MNGINWWRRLGIVCCVMVTLGCISGCQWNLDNLKQYSQDSSARDSKKDETKRVFRFYLAATNEFNYNEVKYGSQYDLIWQQASSNELKRQVVHTRILKAQQMLYCLSCMTS